VPFALKHLVEKEVYMRGHRNLARVLFFCLSFLVAGLITPALAQANEELQEQRAPYTVDENGAPLNADQAEAVVNENLESLEHLSETLAVDLTQSEPAETPAELQQQFTNSVLGTIYSNPQLTTFSSLLQASTLPELLAGEGSFTVFAPTNAALAALPDGTLEALLVDPVKLTATLRYHVVSGSLPIETLSTLTTVDTLAEQQLSVSFDQGLRVNNVALVAVDVLASNGTVHTVAGLLTLPVQQNALLQTNTATLDTILMSDPDYSLFVALLEHTGLLNTLSVEGSFTVFVPRNEALAALPEETLTQLQNPDRLLEILAYHVSLQKASSFQLGTLTTLPTMFGEVSLGKDFGKTTVNGFYLVGEQVQGKNGVIHVIDGLLLPTQSLVQGNQ
jgi:transforming growth factor-beta-induced protein